MKHRAAAKRTSRRKPNRRRRTHKVQRGGAPATIEANEISDLKHELTWKPEWMWAVKRAETRNINADKIDFDKTTIDAVRSENPPAELTGTLYSANVNKGQVTIPNNNVKNYIFYAL